MPEIEPQIKNLVTLLNKVPYLQTISSCQGHFLEHELNENGMEEYAHIRFELPEEKEGEFKELAYFILSQTSPHWSEFLVELHKRYYSLPEEGNLCHDWHLEITPFELSSRTPSEKRKHTDQAIALLEEILTNYLKNDAQ